VRRAASLLLALLPALATAQALNPAVTQANVRSTICVSGWTATIRPPTSYTNGVKRLLMRRIGAPLTQMSAYELDHLVPLTLGGAPRDRRNLVLQAWDGPDGARAKDVVEVRMKRLVCAGRVTLAAARECMATDWHTCRTERSR